MIERQELFCHACQQYVQFDLDLESDGKHVITCPNCKHEHYRYVVNGKVTDERWASSGPTYYASTYTTNSTTTSTFTTYSGLAGSTTTASNYYYNSWYNSGTGT